MARTDSLGNFLADIAAVIKEKKGTTSPISAKDFDTEIEEVVEIAKEDYKTLDNDGIHLSTKYNNWQEEIAKEENEIVHIPAGVSPEKAYAPLDPSYIFTKVKLRYDSLKIEQQSRGEHCMFTSDSDLNEVEIWSGSTSMTVKVTFAIDHESFKSRAYLFDYEWDNNTQQYNLSNTIREMYYYRLSSQLISGSSTLKGPDDAVLSLEVGAELICTTPELWKPAYAELVQAFVNPIIPAETYICKDNEWINIENTISADKYADGNEVSY